MAKRFVSNRVGSEAVAEDGQPFGTAGMLWEKSAVAELRSEDEEHSSSSL